MDRFLCVILCLVVLAVALFLLASCGDPLENIPVDTEPSMTTEPTVAETEPTIAETEPLIEETEPTIVETEPPIQLYDVPLDRDLQIHIIELCEERGVDPALAMAVIYVESNFQADAIGDSGNSFGLMQIQPRWHSLRMDRLGCTDLLDPYQNTTVGIDFLAELITNFNGCVGPALVAYNAGDYAGVITTYAETVLACTESFK